MKQETIPIYDVVVAKLGDPFGPAKPAPKPRVRRKPSTAATPTTEQTGAAE